MPADNLHWIQWETKQGLRLPLCWLPFSRCWLIWSQQLAIAWVSQLGKASDAGKIIGSLWAPVIWGGFKKPTSPFSLNLCLQPESHLLPFNKFLSASTSSCESVTPVKLHLTIKNRTQNLLCVDIYKTSHAFLDFVRFIWYKLLLHGRPDGCYRWQPKRLPWKLAMLP